MVGFKKRLIKDLIHHPDIEDKDVLEVSQIFVEEYGRTSLDEILKEAIPDDNYEPDKIHHDLLKLPWSDVYTTNYDTLLERAKNVSTSETIKLFMILMISQVRYNRAL
ncbi:hypothetical protein ACTIGL_28695 (plasmid) [Bacillus shihchuchen]|uniref:Uncharacterized protein n=1 Tax=Bacillus shihchuchen TaxID=3036942 RepID=A0ABT7KZ87_9BACI|nr:hypothetical protein [Bacillus shihchuchen]